MVAAWLVWLCWAAGSGAGEAVGRAKPPVYRSPLDLAFSPHGRTLAVSDHTAGKLALVDVATARVTGDFRLGGRLGGVVWSPDGETVWVAEHTAASVAQLRPSDGTIRRLPVGPRPFGLALAPRRGWLLVSDMATDEVWIVDTTTGRLRARLHASREPYYLAVTPDETMAVVGNRLPAGDASDVKVSASVTLIDLESLTVAAGVALPPNGVNVHGVAISSDGRWAYVAHNLARAALPAEMIEHGWINANALSVIDLRHKVRYATVLLDYRKQGAANPWGVAVSADGKWLWVALSGVHQVGRLDLGKLHAELLKHLPPPKAARPSEPADGGRDATQDGIVYGAQVFSQTARQYGDDPTSVELVVSDLPAAYGQGVYLGGLFVRVDLPGQGPRGLALSDDGRTLAAALYYTGNVALLDPQTMAVAENVTLGPQPQPDEARRGEMIFHDATRCYQQWLSCATCHPDGRADGLNWDLPNDGAGNPKNTRSLLLSHRTPPVTSTGVRADMETAVEAGFRHFLLRAAEEPDLRAVESYLRHLTPDENPYLIDGRLSERATRGRRLFESRETGCARCHPRPLMTDLKLHDVGTAAGFDRQTKFDTPSLIEGWRTAPYLHHGKATRLRQVVTKFNRRDRHGRTSHLSDEQLDHLVEYLESL